MKLLFIIYYCASSLISCAEKQTNSPSTSSEIVKEETFEKNGDNLPVFIDLNENYKKKTINIQDIADVEYIPLETRDDVLLNIGTRVVEISDSLIIMSDSRQQKVFFFNRAGKFLNSFSHSGGGPHEYRKMEKVCADFTKKEIFVLDIGTLHRILVYSFSGEFKRIINFPKQIKWITVFYNYDNDFLICYDQVGGNIKNRGINTNPYFLICKKTGKLKPLDIEIKQHIDSRVSFELENGVLRSIEIQIHPMIKSLGEIVISDFSLDTVYTYSKNKLRPLAIRNTSSQKGKYPLLSLISVKTNRYLFFNIIEKHIDIKNPKLLGKYQQLVYDKKINEIYEPIFLYDIIKEKENIQFDTHSMSSLPHNSALERFSAEKLVELYNENRLRGKLKEITSKLREDDNPVLMLVKFKE